MRKAYFKKFNKAYALAYVVFLMAFVLVATTIMFSVASLSVNGANSYKNYVNQKQFLDESVAFYLNEGELPSSQNDYNITFFQEQNYLIAKSGEKTLLTVIFSEENGVKTVVNYVYGEY